MISRSQVLPLAREVWRRDIKTTKPEPPRPWPSLDSYLLSLISYLFSLAPAPPRPWPSLDSYLLSLISFLLHQHLRGPGLVLILISFLLHQRLIAGRRPLPVGSSHLAQPLTFHTSVCSRDRAAIRHSESYQLLLEYRIQNGLIHTPTRPNRKCRMPASGFHHAADQRSRR